MKKVFALIATSLLLVGCTKTQKYRNISVEEFYAAVEEAEHNAPTYKKANLKIVYSGNTSYSGTFQYVSELVSEHDGMVEVMRWKFASGDLIVGDYSEFIGQKASGKFLIHTYIDEVYSLQVEMQYYQSSSAFKEEASSPDSLLYSAKYNKYGYLLSVDLKINSFYKFNKLTISYA